MAPSQVARLSREKLAGYTRSIEPCARRTALALRRHVLAVVPEAVEAIKFGSLCYFVGGSAFGSIGGNICLIQFRRRGARTQVELAFIQGRDLPDPGRLLRVSGRAKRVIGVADAAAARDPRIAAILRASADRAGRAQRGAARRPSA